MATPWVLALLLMLLLNASRRGIGWMASYWTGGLFVGGKGYMVLFSPFHSFREALQLNTTVGGALNYILGLDQFMEEQHIVFDTPKVGMGWWWEH